MLPASAAAASAPRGAAAWHALLAQIDRTVGAAGSGDAARAFGPLGARRHANARRYLARERQRLVGELRRMGLHEWPWLSEPPGAATAAAPPGAGRLVGEFMLLALAYEDCAHLAGEAGLPELSGWLAERARIHREHAALLAW